MLIILVRYQLCCQRSRCAVIGRTAGRRAEDRPIRLFSKNAINSRYCMNDHLRPSRIQEKINQRLMPGIRCVQVAGMRRPGKENANNK
ncbi:hypothetical protein MNBD_DELTA04-1021 [hydrothermal vent metagenome]|uniref:Uncharacterized protein n=1 Tax=hydrothermal vent metagenome TaxID=652676 RepID=A0A3B0V856_9ZZZZ